MTLSHHPGSSSGPLPFTLENEAGNPRRTFHSLHPTLVSTTAVHFELGPRSLDPAAVFAARMPSLFETRRRLTTSATATTTCGQPNQLRLSFPRRDGGLDHLPFLYAPRRSATEIAEQWHAASRASFASANPGAGSSRLPRFAQPRCLRERPTTAEFPRRCIVRGTTSAYAR